MKFENKYCDSNDLDTIPFDTGDWISDLSKFIHCIGIVNSVIRQSDWFHMANLLRRLAFFKTSWKFVVFIKELLLKIIFVLKNWNKNHFLKEIFCALYKHKLSKFCGNVITFHDVNVLKTIFIYQGLPSRVYPMSSRRIQCFNASILSSSPPPNKYFYIKSRKQDIWFVKCIIYLKTRT